MRVLQVAYPFARLNPDPVGGAEQILLRLHEGLGGEGVESHALAAAGSAGVPRLILGPPCPDVLTEDARRDGEARLSDRIRRLLAGGAYDLVHYHGVDAPRHLVAGPPSLVTLHLPLDAYPAEFLREPPPGVSLQPVSLDQARRAPPGARLLDPIANGVETAGFPPSVRGGYLLALGRICAEKGFHHALDAARREDLDLRLAGEVYPYPEHTAYFEAQIRPRLDARRRWIGPVRGEAKRRLLAGADCVVVPSLVAETSSLVAREALAAGAPVAAFRSGALVEVVEEGRTGALADDPVGLGPAIRRAMALDRETCRGAAGAFSAPAMVRRYARRYAELLGASAPAPASRPPALRPGAAEGRTGGFGTR